MLSGPDVMELAKLANLPFTHLARRLGKDETTTFRRLKRDKVKPDLLAQAVQVISEETERQVKEAEERRAVVSRRIAALTQS